MMQDIYRLKRVGWAVRGVFALGIAASLAGNVLHAADNPISRAISAWSPLSLLLAVELISRVPASKGLASFARLFATAVIAGIAAWVSYWHMAGVASRYGETGASPYLLPLSVDGLIVVASISLVEIGGRLRRFAKPEASPATQPAATSAPAATVPKPASAPNEVVASAVKRPARPKVTTAERVARFLEKNPDATQEQVAARLKVTVRTVQRHWPRREATVTALSAAA
ncbi:hypothetical protein DMB66_27660 [Actinoplanes sp. ATCC 53533]|uniref:DUF2637 domain-containing protein n=1 Tax=Actinoplanes sp. ATCC 53533 TaxID=1288362 RepID=UPI000F790C39|nr:DUF2637 domain-containing protein [Actinoplanes sp. ATCC 53533]RSM59465.1 hypothetical protein DMB66_27660 [Actinoplanes sp. ATCC 53533]